MTAVVGLIYQENKSSDWRKKENLVDWCGLHNLHLNVGKTKQMEVDFRMRSHTHSLMVIGGTAMEMVAWESILPGF